MAPEELLSIMTAGAVAPYALEAALGWISRTFRSTRGANAPTWFRLQRNCTHSA